MARAVGLRNILVQEYAETDNRRVLAQLDQLPGLEAFVTAVAQWLVKQR
ncbi:MAG: HepT-like ribonuclease domain-containing protein [Mycobacteriales bacterium]